MDKIANNNDDKKNAAEEDRKKNEKSNYLTSTNQTSETLQTQK